MALGAPGIAAPQPGCPVQVRYRLLHSCLSRPGPTAKSVMRVLPTSDLCLLSTVWYQAGTYLSDMDPDLRA